MVKVTVIVAVYNVEKYLHRCLDSLVNQTLEDIEILVINDGSTDGSLQIIEFYQERFPAIVFGFSKNNGGLSDARNFGLELAKGDYIGFVDGDDYVEKTMFETLYFLSQNHQSDLVICNLRKVDGDGNLLKLLPQIPHLPEKILLEKELSVFSDLSYFACNKLFRNTLFEKNRFRKGMHFEDIQLIPILLLKCNVISHTQEYLYNYVERESSISRIHSEKGLDILRAVEEVEMVYKKSKFRSREKELRGFLILEGFYTFLAYLAFVKDQEIYFLMRKSLHTFLRKRGISLFEILLYKRFGENYLFSMPVKKQFFYLAYFLRIDRWLRYFY
ncbi:MAG: glycosyltransferase [Bergeyella sp.]|nr:glycosyltransferase [Bergeyella sp.]